MTTTDLGETWIHGGLTYADDGFVDVVVKNKLEIYTASWNGFSFHSNDGGKTWTQKFISTFIICGIGSTPTSKSMFAMGPFWFYKQNNTGEWDLVGSTTNFWSFGDFSIDPRNNNIYAGGNNWDETSAAIVKSTNEGVSWETKELGDDGAVRNIIFCKNSKEDTYAVGDLIKEQRVYACIWQKKGDEWAREYIHPFNENNNNSFMQACETSNYVYVVGGNGVIVRKKKSLNVSIKKNNLINTTSTNFSLSQNYPNPFNPTTKISYDITKSSVVTLKIYDISGREIASLVDEKKNAGSYETTFDGSKFSSGTYFYKLTAGKFTSAKKMTLIK